jgi:hypothetical protein
VSKSRQRPQDVTVRASIAQRLQQQPPNSFLVGKAMLRQDDRSEGLFKQNPVGRPYPADHPLRMSRQLVDAALAELSRAFAKLYARDGRPSIPPERLPRGAAACRRWAIDARTVASCGRCRLLDTRSHDDHWTKCRHPQTAHDTFRPMIVPFDDLELVYQSLRN